MTKSLRLWPKLKNNLPNIIVFVFLCTMYYVLSTNLGRDALFDWDEGIYAELGRTLSSGRNLLVPSWNGAPWLEKPPGIAWVSALGIFLAGLPAQAGPTALGARLLMPLFAIYTLYTVYRIGAHLGNWRHGLIAAAVLSTFNLFLGRTRALNTDMPLLASVTTTILFLLKNRPAWWVALAVFGGVWFKGLAGLLSLIIALPLFVSKSKKYLLLTSYYLLLFLLPWHLYTYLRYGTEFSTPYFIEQVIRRATAQIEFHFETRWYYFNYLYQNLGLGVLLVSGFGALTLLLRRQHLFLLWWVFAPLLIFTLAKTRLFWYILPLYPALALLVSQAIASWQNSPKSKGIVSILALGISLQALLATSASVELGKSTATIPDRISAASQLKALSHGRLMALVPPSERLSEALLPEIARLSSSFRYGGMPSVVFYYQGPVQFFYNVDTFRAAWQEASTPTALVTRDDLDLIPGSFQIVVETPSYLGIQKGVYALR